MESQQYRWQPNHGWEPAPPNGGSVDLVLVFAGPEALRNGPALAELRGAFPGATLFGCSSAGEIHGTRVTDGALVATAVRFAHTRHRGAIARVGEYPGSEALGRAIADQLADDGLRHVLVLSDGLRVNGSKLVQGLENRLPPGVTVSGGLSGDGGKFRKTFVLLDGEPETGLVAAVGLYGNGLRVGCGSLGGWDPFGPERLITRSEANVLHELDGRSVLSLYKEYLGEHADGLPATALLFPLSLRARNAEHRVVRTVLSVDEKDQSMTFAGDMPSGWYARFMKANFDRLIDGALGAAKRSEAGLRHSRPELAILISCYGRKMVLQDLVEEEVEAVREVLGGSATITGMYSYGEISPFAPGASCELHNQTMTITTLSEA